jgi:heat-inducible transcriptional repressor
MAKQKLHIADGSEPLSQRQRDILRLIIQQYVLTANPVGSRYISRISAMGLSDATLRNVMSDLEYLGYIDHPHTSAGRMPTDKGYRMYVDTLMNSQMLSEAERKAVEKTLGIAMTPEDILRESTGILATLSKQLSLLVLPALDEGILERVEIVQLSSSRILVVLAVSGGRVRTLTLETDSGIGRTRIDELCSILNQRLAGRSLREVRAIFRDSVQDLKEEDKAILRMFINSPERLFEDPGSERVKLAGAGNIFSQPEFQKKGSYADEEFQSIIELIENEEVVIHVLERSGMMYDATNVGTEGVKIRIGSELDDERMLNYSVISTKYQIGEQRGTIAVIGPKRMDYARIAPLVDYVARSMSQPTFTK